MPAASRWLRRSPHDVARTLDRLEQAVLQHGGIVRFGRIDHAAIARRSGGSSRPVETLQMENPGLVARLLAIEPALAWALPIKAMAWEDDNGLVWLRVTDPQSIASVPVESPQLRDVISSIEGILCGWVDHSVAQDQPS